MHGGGGDCPIGILPDGGAEQGHRRREVGGGQFAHGLVDVRHADAADRHAVRDVQRLGSDGLARRSPVGIDGSLVRKVARAEAGEPAGLTGHHAFQSLATSREDSKLKLEITRPTCAA